MDDPYEPVGKNRGVGTLPDRCKPARLERQNPHLTALLQRDYQRTVEPALGRVTADNSAKVEVEADHDRSVGLKAARGVCIAMLLGLAVWAAIGACVWLLWRHTG